MKYTVKHDIVQDGCSRGRNGGQVSGIGVGVLGLLWTFSR